MILSAKKKLSERQALKRKRKEAPAKSRIDDEATGSGCYRPNAVNERIGYSNEI